MIQIAFGLAGYQYRAGLQIVRKTTSPARLPSELGPVDAVLQSHDQHGDDLDPAGRTFLSQVKQVLTTPAAALRLGGNACGVPTWETANLRDANGLEVQVTATQARHGPEEIRDVTGDVTGWMLAWEGQRRGVLYISGDTVFFEGLEEIARRCQIGGALLHFGAARTQRFGSSYLTFTAVTGAQVARMLGEATIMPIHYEGWTHFTEGRPRLSKRLRRWD